MNYICKIKNIDTSNNDIIITCIVSDKKEVKARLLSLTQISYYPKVNDRVIVISINSDSYVAMPIVFDNEIQEDELKLSGLDGAVFMINKDGKFLLENNKAVLKNLLDDMSNIMLDITSQLIIDICSTPVVQGAPVSAPSINEYTNMITNINQIKSLIGLLFE